MTETGKFPGCDSGAGSCEAVTGSGQQGITYSQQMAEFVAGLKFTDIPGDVIEKAKLLVLDTLGVALAAVREDFTRNVRDVANALKGPAESTVWGSRKRLPAANAVLVNGTMAHGHDFDDMHRAASSHLSVVAIPAAFAVAEKYKRPGSEILAALVAGYEAGARIGLAARRKLLSRGWHPTAVFGAFTAAAIAGRLSGLDASRTAAAFGIAGSQASGLAQWLEEGSWTKRMHPGWAAHSGILAAQFAATGFGAPARIFEGVHGLYRAFLRDGNFDLGELNRDLGRRWETRQICIKLYPAGY